MLKAIPIPRSNVIFRMPVPKFYRDRAPAAVGIRLWVVAQRIEMSQVVPDRGKRVLLILPVISKINFSAGGSGHALKYRIGDRFQVCLFGAYHVDRRSSGLRQLGNFFGRHHAGVVGAV